ncbi:Cyclin-D1-1 [Hibiscus syriacus]|uniref:Cyclin-D1-1 n=1 Tax=Hibiscus syriacus TaxID=106335 RepID=A0A6A3CA81_HIBSY|nr:Cyclin-D1-1 [Hibiscus syriacus]
MPFSDYLRRCQQRSINVIARQDSINWILKVHAYYNFNPVTAFLSVNYLDRFLSSHSLLLENGWPFQLLSVTCLSLAAKMEELEVPLLLDLQVLEPRFVFEPKTIQRMELRVMDILNWRLRSVTPFDYLHHFVSKLPSDSFDSLISASSDLILSTTRVIDFLQFTPSTMAAAAVFCAAEEGSKFPADDVFFHESVNKVGNGEKLSPTNGEIHDRLVSICSAQEPKSRAVSRAYELSRHPRCSCLWHLFWNVPIIPAPVPKLSAQPRGYDPLIWMYNNRRFGVCHVRFGANWKTREEVFLKGKVTRMMEETIRAVQVSRKGQVYWISECKELI